MTVTGEMDGIDDGDVENGALEGEYDGEVVEMDSALVSFEHLPMARSIAVQGV